MAFKTAFFLLGAWLLIALGGPDTSIVHLLLLGGLLVFLIAFLKARAAAARGNTSYRIESPSAQRARP